MAKFTNGRWAPCQSGNPGGRPGGVAEVRELARTHTAEAIERLVKELNDGDTSHACIAAANTLLDRGYGKPMQPIGGDPTGVPVQMTVERRVALARQAVTEASARSRERTMMAKLTQQYPARRLDGERNRYKIFRVVS
jgi:hypothetical protein